jgi:hypothetical protein
LVIG